MHNSSTYDYIIAGAGAAGLSLLFQLLGDETLQQKRILVLDAIIKNENDRTWCFWDKHPSVFDPIVSKQWNYLKFISSNYNATKSISPYSYKMIKGIDFYNEVLSKAKSFENVTFKVEKIINYNQSNTAIKVITNANTYAAQYVFNSIVFDPPVLQKKEYYLLQHFLGWEIEVSTDIFDDQVATLMDFNVTQQNGDAFVYVLPINKQKALIEYTLFSKKLLNREQYQEVLSAYISNELKIKNYTITHVEYGVIPMTNHRFKQHDGRLIHIGTAGGAVKGSTGYAFRFIQQQIQSIISKLKKNEVPHLSPNFKQQKFSFYDGVMLRVLNENKLTAPAIFEQIFSRNNVVDVLQFLNNESNLIQDIKIMSSVPTSKFLPTAIKQLI